MVAGQEDLPPTLRQVLTARVGNLSPAASTVLTMVAIAGTPVCHDLLVALGLLSDGDLIRAIRECVDQQLLLVEPRGNGYTFRHSLLREAVEEQLLPAERTALHRACARALTADRSLACGSPAAELAWHWYAAGDYARALPASVEAAVAAESSFGFAEACAHLERALQLWESDTAPDLPGAPRVDGLELRMRAAECANLAGDHARAAALARVAAGSLGPGAAAGSAAGVWERLGGTLGLGRQRGRPRRLPAGRRARGDRPGDPGGCTGARRPGKRSDAGRPLRRIPPPGPGGARHRPPHRSTPRGGPGSGRARLRPGLLRRPRRGGAAARRGASPRKTPTPTAWPAPTSS